ncbi:hypothetical protein PIROE2DRAFT_65110 [Piromyces sp. E2]|nr:hypothetical protein PIROE2DRAFT_65110 [Piromyces sp. E2]|eukprot:OUM57250.1 hypothetical protein PIROE2DRAFT_65110 [Piromyces sp. E2]
MRNHSFEVNGITNDMANFSLTSDTTEYNSSSDTENNSHSDGVNLQFHLDQIHDVKYMFECHPVLYFLLVMFNSIKGSEEEEYQEVCRELKKFLKNQGLLKVEVEVVEEEEEMMDDDDDDDDDDHVPLLPLNELIYRCFDHLPEKLINMAKVFTIKNCYRCNRNRLNKMIVINCYIIYQLGCLVFDEFWYRYDYPKHGWTQTSELEIVQDINIFFAMNLEALAKQVGLSLDGFTFFISHYLCTNFIGVKDIGHLHHVLFLRNFRQRIDKSPVLRFNDCVYDFRIRATRSGRPSDFCVKGTGYDFYSEENNEETRELLMQFFRDVFVEEDLISYVLKILASTLTHGNKLRSLIFFIGSGSNGKTTLGNMMKYTMGDYAASPNVSLFLGRSVSAEKPNPHMYELNNARVAICEEPDPGTVTITGDAKAITGNVGTLKTRTLYRDLEVIYVDLLPIINTNFKLSISNLDNALIDRIIVVPFLQRFIPKYKKEEEEREGDTHVRMVQSMWQGRQVQRFAPALMHLLLDYYQEDYTLVKMPDIVKKYTEGFVLRCDHVGRFIKFKLQDVLKNDEEEEDDDDGDDDGDDESDEDQQNALPLEEYLAQKNISSDAIISMEEVYNHYRKWYRAYVNTSSLNYTITEFRMDLNKYGIRLRKGQLEEDYLIGYRLV